MTATLKNGIVHKDIVGGDHLMSKEEAFTILKSNNTTAGIAPKWHELFETTTPNRASVICTQLNELIIASFHNATELQPIISSLNALIIQTTKLLKEEIVNVNSERKELIQTQLGCLNQVKISTFYTHQSIAGERLMEQYKTCMDFKSLIEQFGNTKELQEEYEVNVAFAPSRKMHIEFRIKSQTDSLKQIRITHKSWWPTPDNEISYEFGEYKRIGYAWAIQGYNPRWSEFETATNNNLSLNAAIPLERRVEYYVSLISYIIQGGALGQHIGFLQNELDKANSNGIQVTTHKIHFEDFSGQLFERLVFAYLNKTRKWSSLKWLGESGQDEGRDIWGIESDKTSCFQCANYINLNFRKSKADIDKLIDAGFVPNYLFVVAGGKISASLDKKIKDYAFKNGISHCETWSGAELEEKLRKEAPELLKRFVSGDIALG